MLCSAEKPVNPRQAKTGRKWPHTNRKIHGKKWDEMLSETVPPPNKKRKRKCSDKSCPGKVLPIH
ncbi:hypothetical protein B4098_0895 [Heyndrickxia coagulans]|uniref:Uncharacterized protein n=1 Tax=Heyndrickxia coagulans TaxID=1398 RepID=A0A150JZI2_HEYCO|nr:hypothetical protein B4098_0895 [Heyndrickxia coagulans]